ncbi:PREDICTED: peroxisomal hydratase-dehydrogenase-epimerase-like [Atta cephalotes]|uniref:Uncharacterized protein n=1 Tax=Atta cephalotes TaxID=12957 RepID=A0A158NCW8_ATTCE|nr:PREDICTED: peroxisomal hydratase-dehydrogenase-epimerase-like [Atta cephalotes]
MCTSKARLDGKTIIITGAGRGLGKETARDLYARGARVILACRSMERANKAVEDIKNNPPSRINKDKYKNNAGELAIYSLDLCSLKSVKDCAKNLLTNEAAIHMLINNAGIGSSFSLEKTEDGNEMTLQVNHLSHFLLTLLLLPKMQLSSPNCKIINVSSNAHMFADIDFDDINLERSYTPFKSYAQSKLANILFTKELTNRLRKANIHGINTYCLHPGVIQTEIWDHVRNTMFPGANFVFTVFGPFLYKKNIEQGVQTTIYCSVDEKTVNDTGLYYSNCNVAASSRNANNRQYAIKLWNTSCQLLHLEPEEDFTRFLETVSRQIYLYITEIKKDYKMWFLNKTCTSKTRLDGKTVVITGASGGIGKETARDLYARGARVILACRNMEKANKAVEDIKNNPLSRFEKSKYKNNAGELAIYFLDLCSLKNVRDCAKNLLTNEAAIHILINNAGVATYPNKKTEDGNQTTLQVNHLGHFLLTLLLLPKMQKSSPNCRIINVSSIAHMFADIDFDDINLERSYGPIRSYAQSKLANILFTKELARRLKTANIHGINVYSLHPGLIPTDISRYSSNTIFPGATLCYTLFAQLFYKNAEQGAQTTIYCCIDEEVANETGLYYSNCGVTTPYRKANKHQYPEKLWNVSCRLLHLEPEEDFTTFLETVSRQML